MTTPRPNSQVECEWIAECIESCKSRTVYVEDHGVRATFLNPTRKPVRKIHYDGCYARKRDTKQADFIISLPKILDVIVEPKGSDTNLTGERGANKQLEYTLHAWLQYSNRSPRIAALIISGVSKQEKSVPGDFHERQQRF